MKPKQFDLFLQKMFQNHKIKVDKNEMWQGVVQKIERKKRKKRAFILLLLLGSGIFLSLLSSLRHTSGIAPEHTAVVAQQPSLNTGAITTLQADSPATTTADLLGNPSTVSKEQLEPIYTAAETQQKDEYRPEPPLSRQQTTAEYSYPHFNSPPLRKDIYPEHPLIEHLPRIKRFSPVGIPYLRFINVHLPMLIGLISSVEGSFLEHTTSVGFAFGFGQHTNLYGSNSDNYAAHYTTKRQQKETPLDDLHFGLTVRKDLSSHFFIRSGIFAFQRKDLYSDTIKEQGFTQAVFQAFPYLGHNTWRPDPFNVVVEQRSILSTVYRIYNEYTGFNVPLSLGYQYVRGKNAFQVSVGLSLNYRLAVKGYTTFKHAAVLLSDFKYNDVLVYDNWLYFNALSRLRYERQYTANTHVFVGALAEKSLGNILNTSSGLIHQYKSLALEAGFRHRLR